MQMSSIWALLTNSSPPLAVNLCCPLHCFLTCFRYKHRVSHGKLKGQHMPLYVDMSLPTKYWGASSIKAPAPAPSGSGADSTDPGADGPEAATDQAVGAAGEAEAGEAGQSAGSAAEPSSKGSRSEERSRQGGIQELGLRGERRRRR